MYIKKYSRVISTLTNYLGQIKLPIYIREFLYKKYINYYNVVFLDFVKDLKDYSNFQEFFTRKVKN